MALKNTSDNTYLRILVKDTAPINLGQKLFVGELSKDEATRTNPGAFDKAQYPKFQLAESWALDITGSATIDEIIAEAYRCIKLDAQFGAESDWVDA